MNSRRTLDDSPTVTDLWRLMMETLQTQWRQASGVLQKEGLTPGHLRVLSLLASGEPRPMGWLAQSMTCDASTMTWLVDRLEERKLVERKTLLADRRVKTIVLTSKGKQTVAKLQRHLYEPPEALKHLDAESLQALYDVFSVLVSKQNEGTSA